MGENGHRLNPQGLSPGHFQDWKGVMNEREYKACLRALSVLELIQKTGFNPGMGRIISEAIEFLEEALEEHRLTREEELEEVKVRS